MSEMIIQVHNNDGDETIQQSENDWKYCRWTVSQEQSVKDWLESYNFLRFHSPTCAAHYIHVPLPFDIISIYLDFMNMDQHIKK